MKIKVQAKPRSKQEKIEKVSDSEYRVWVKEPPTDGKANEAIIKLLSKYLKIPQSSITLTHGARGKIKFFEF